MFKRQFYAVDHADNDDASSSDSSVNTGSDSDSAHEPEDENDEASSPNDVTPGSEDSDSEEGGEPGESESEDEEWSTFRDRNVKVVQPIDSAQFLSKKTKTEGADESGEAEAPPESVGDRIVLRIKGVLKCRYCVKVICLSDESMKTHLLSKRHARSLKKLANGKLKVQLNSDGEEEEEAETHAERLARTKSIAEEKPVERKANKGRQRQHKRTKRIRVGKAERAKLRTATLESG